MNGSELEHETRVYVEVLRIPPDHCPPNYFELLNIPVSGDISPEAITTAAQQTAGKLSKSIPADLHLAARKIVYRIERARVCLCDPNSRATYLAKLQVGGESSIQFARPSATNTSRVDSTSPKAAGSNPGVGSTRPHATVAAASTSNAPAHRTTTSTTAGPTRSSHAPAVTRQKTRDTILDLGPSTHLELAASKSPSQVPLYVLIGAAGTVGLGALAYSLLGQGPPIQSAKVENPVPALVVQELVESPSSDTPPASPTAKSSAGGPQAILGEVSDLGEQRTPPAEPVETVEEPTPQPLSIHATDNSPEQEVAPQIPVVTETPTLTDIPPQVELPALDVAKSETSTTDDEGMAETELGKMSAGTFRVLQVSLSQPTLARYAGTSFSLKEVKGAQDERLWEVHLTATPPAKTPEADKSTARSETSSSLDEFASGFDEIVGTIFYQDETLKFRWSTPEHRNFAEQLRNSLLLLAAGSDAVQIQLRSTKDIGPFVTDLTERNLLFELEDASALPATDALRMRIGSVSLAGTPYELQPTDGIAGYRDSVDVRLTNWQGDASLRFTLVGSKDTLTVKFTPRYKVGRIANNPLTSDGIRRAITKLEQQIPKSQDMLAAAHDASRSIPGEISRLEGQRNPNNSSQISAQIKRLSMQLNKAEGTIRRMESNLPDMEAGLAGLNALADVARQFDQQGTVAFEVFVPCNEGELVLLRTGSTEP